MRGFCLSGLTNGLQACKVVTSRGKMAKKLGLFVALILSLAGCELGTDYTPETKIYTGSFGFDVAYRVRGNTVYSGSYGYNVAYRIDGDTIYSGSHGLDIAYRKSGNIIYSGGFGFNIAYRVDGKSIYSGSFGFNVAYRIE